MSKSLISVLALATVSSMAILYKSYFKKDEPLLPRDLLVAIIIDLRKKIFSALREIAYVANIVQVTQADIEPRKIKDILMRDGAPAELKLLAIEEFVITKHKVTRQAFEHSCNHYSHFDVEVKMLLQTFKNSVQLALEGTVESYYGPLPRLTGSQVIKVYRQTLQRRMRIIEDKFLHGVGNDECIRREAEIEDYLECEGICHAREPNEKIFLALLENLYKNDAEFKEEFELLELEFEQFIEEVKRRKNENQEARTEDREGRG